MTIKESSKIKTVCKKCKSVVIVIDWEFGNYEYVCAKCGYSTLNKNNVEEVKEEKNGN